MFTHAAQDPTDHDKLFGKNISIHGLRGALAFFIFCLHIVNSGLPTFKSPAFLAINHFLFSLHFGVEIFFGISGIVILFAFRRSTSFSRFFVNRVTRIFPVLWVTLAFALVLSVVSHRYEPDFKDYKFYLAVIANLLAMPTMIPVHLIHPAAWSLSYECTFYLFVLAFGVASACPSKKMAICILSFLGAAILATHLRGVPFVLGLLIAATAGRINPRFFLLRCPGIMMLAAFLAWQESSLLVSPDAINERIAPLLFAPAALGLWLLASLCALAGLGGVFYGNGLFSKILRTPVMQWLGTISFSFYMWQTIVMGVVKFLMHGGHLAGVFGPWSQVVFFGLAALPTLYISHLSQVYIEGRLTRRLRAAFG